MSATNKDDCSSDPTPCSAADGPQLPSNADRSADDVILAVVDALDAVAQNRFALAMSLPFFRLMKKCDLLIEACAYKHAACIVRQVSKEHSER